MINVPTSLNNSKTKVRHLDVGKLETVPVDLKKLSNVVDNEVVKSTKFKTLKTKINTLNKKVSYVTTLIPISQITINFNFKNCLFETSSVVKILIKKGMCKWLRNNI